MADLTGLLFLLLLLLGPLIQVLNTLAERKKKQNEQNAKQPNLQEVYGVALAEQEEKLQENELPVLAEALEIVYDSGNWDGVPAKSKRTPKIRSKSSRKKITEPVAQPVLAAAVEPVVESAPMLAGTSQPQPNPLAAGIFKMFQSPAGVQQAVLVSEILKKRF